MISLIEYKIVWKVLGFIFKPCELAYAFGRLLYKLDLLTDKIKQVTQGVGWWTGKVLINFFFCHICFNMSCNDLYFLAYLEKCSNDFLENLLGLVSIVYLQSSVPFVIILLLWQAVVVHQQLTLL